MHRVHVRHACSVRWAWRITAGFCHTFPQCCHSNTTKCKSAQLCTTRGHPLPLPKLHLGLCNSVGMRPWTERQIQTQTHTDKPVGFYGPSVPPGPNAPSLKCPLNIVPNSEFRMCPDPEFPNALHSEFMNTLNVDFLNVPLQRTYVIPCQQQMGSSAVLRARRSALVLAASTRCLRRVHTIGRG